MVRVTRLLEYTYADVEDAIADMENWGVPATGVVSHRRGQTIRSAVIGPVFGEDAEQIHTAVAAPLEADPALVSPEVVEEIAHVWRRLAPETRTAIRRLSEDLYNASGALTTAVTAKGGAR